MFVPSVPGIQALDQTSAAYNQLLIDALEADDVDPGARAIALAVRASGAEIAAAVLRSGMFTGTTIQQSR